jgi:hypothetical protein
VAVVSLFANERVPERKGRGVVKDWSDQFRMQVAESALDIFTAHLKSMGWNVMSSQQVTSMPVYQKTFKPRTVAGSETLGKVASFLQQQHARSFFTPAGMFPIEIADKDMNTHYYGDTSHDPKKLLGAFAKKLNVDAVVLVQLDYCYGGGTWSMLGTGEAIMTAASSIKAVNRNGDLIINMPSIPVCGGDDRAESKGTATMISGDLVFAKLSNDGFRKMFEEATQGSADMTFEKIQKAMN